MTYKELLSLYKLGQLSEKQSAEIEADVEKHQAISDYLFEAEGLPEYSDFDIEKIAEDTSSENAEQDFVKTINKSIRKAFVKFGTAVAVVVLVLVIVLGATLPYIVDAFYYNPAKVIGEGKNYTTNQMTLDTATYTELFTPAFYRADVEVSRDGFGNYDICVPQNFSVNGQFRDAYGAVDKGRLSWFSEGLLRLPEKNVFADNGASMNHSGNLADASSLNEKLLSLDDKDYYIGYITFEDVMSYDELVLWSEANAVAPWWCAVCQKIEKGYQTNMLTGFNYQGFGAEMAYDKEKYPYLNYYDVLAEAENGEASAEIMETHMISMLRYIKEREDFRDMAGCIYSEHSFEQLAMNIEEHGLNIYGFAVVAQRDELIRIGNLENVCYIHTSLFG